METETWVRPARKLKQKDKDETKSASSPGPTPATAEPPTNVQSHLPRSQHRGAHARAITKNDIADKNFNHATGQTHGSSIAKP